MPKCLDKKTALFGVIGDPIAHSLSPFIHNRLYELYDINALYLPLYIKSGTVATALPSVISALDLRGFNITMPHKKAALPLIARLTPELARLGSVNTVTVDDNGRLTGYNTDGGGYILAMEELGLKLENLKITILGSGGAAATLALQLSSLKNNHITLVGIDETAAVAIREKDPLNISYLPWNAPNLKIAAQNAGLLINTTPLGMEHYGDYDDFSFLDHLPKEAAVSDLIYAPPKTALLAEAEKRGHLAANGLSMLIWQAFIAFEHFLGQRPDREDKKAIEKDLVSSGLTDRAFI